MNKINIQKIIFENKMKRNKIFASYLLLAGISVYHQYCQDAFK
jgi:hypothetical protein